MNDKIYSLKIFVESAVWLFLSLFIAFIITEHYLVWMTISSSDPLSVLLIPMMVIAYRYFVYLTLLPFVIQLHTLCYYNVVLWLGAGLLVGAGWWAIFRDFSKLEFCLLTMLFCWGFVYRRFLKEKAAFQKMQQQLAQLKQRENLIH